MSIEQEQKTVNQFNKDIADLEKKMSSLVSKEADITKKSSSVERSITKNTSTNMLKTKMRQIEGYKKDLSKILYDKANINKKIADKRKRLSDATIKLQKEESIQAKSLATQQEEIYATYERQISELTEQIKLQEIVNTSSNNTFDCSNAEEYDVFVSHATEDKESFCNEFVEILQNKYNLKVWYDSISLQWGDNIRTEIDKGLRKSKFGVVILSKTYIKKYWTNYELEGLFQRETNGGKLILPIWHDITKQQVQDFSLSLAGKMAMNTAIMTTNEIAEKLNELFESSQK